MKALRINDLLQGETFLWQLFYYTVGESVLAVSQKKGCIVDRNLHILSGCIFIQYIIYVYNL